MKRQAVINGSSEGAAGHIFDVRTAPIEDIARVFGFSLIDAEMMQRMELGLYDGDCVAVDEQGNRLSVSSETDGNQAADPLRLTTRVSLP